MTQATQPLVSIIVPVYNVERYVDECLASIRAQTYANLQILLVEDCSTDGSLKALEPHLEDPRVRLIRHERNGGLSAARNTGIEAAGGDYVMFVDSDDAIDGSLVDGFIRSANDSGADIVLCGFTSFRDGEERPAMRDTGSRGGSERIDPEDYFVYPHFAWLKFMRREPLQNSALRFPVGHYYEDWPFHWELGFSKKGMVRLRHDGYFYRQRGDSITGSGDRKILHIFSAHRLIIEVVERHGGGGVPRRLLGEKIHRGTWFVLTTIKDAYLPEAVAAAKEHLAVTRTQRQHAPAQFKSAVLKALLTLPHPLAVSGIRGLRKLLGVLSPARRQTRSRPRQALKGTA